MKETLLDLDHVPTMEELREYFHKHDFSSACDYTSASKWEKDELCKDDREAVNEVKNMVKREWNEMSAQKGLKSKPANYEMKTIR